MMIAREYEGGRFATAIQLYLIIPQMKIEELAILRADRIDWAEGVLKFDNPKSTALRRREDQPEVMAFVRELVPANARYYFEHSPKDLINALNHCSNRAKAIGTFCPHVIRAAVVTSLVNQNMAGPIIGQFTGHTDERSRRRYTRLDPASVAKQFGAMADASTAALVSEGI